MNNKYSFLGLARVDFENPQTKETIKGYNLWLGEEATDALSCGVKPFKSWIKDADIDGFCAFYGGFVKLKERIGQQVNVSFNRYGKVQSMEFVAVK